jgi:hypothetical protein
MTLISALELTNKNEYKYFMSGSVPMATNVSCDT